MADNKWFIRGVPDELVKQVTDTAKARGQTVGRLVTDILRAGLDSLSPVGQTVDCQSSPDEMVDLRRSLAELSKRVSQLEEMCPPISGTAALPATGAKTPAVPPPAPVVPAAGENPAPLAQMDIEDVIGGKGHATTPTQKRQPPGGIHPASDALATALLAMNKAGKSWQAIANEVKAKTGFKGSDQTFNAWGKGRRPVTIHGGRVLISTFPELAAAAHPTEMESDE